MFSNRFSAFLSPFVVKFGKLISDVICEEFVTGCTVVFVSFGFMQKVFFFLFSFFLPFRLSLWMYMSSMQVV